MRRAVLLYAMFMAVQVSAQMRAPLDVALSVDQNLNKGIEGDPLGCEINDVKPYFDFEFRFSTGYFIQCPVKIFDGKPDLLNVFTRIVAPGKAPVVLYDRFVIPGADDLEGRDIDIRKVQTQLEYSGMFLTGEGIYSVDVLILDRSARVAHKHWQFTAERKHDELSAEVSVPPCTVDVAHLNLWDGSSKMNGTGRLTILLNVAPIHPGSLKLRTADRAVLLQWASDVLRDLNPASVRMVAFSLDQQRELFRKDDFSGADMHELEQRMRQMELGTVQIKTYVNRKGWADMLNDLIESESSAKDAPDAVIVVGPHSHFDEKLPKELRTGKSSGRTRFYYFEFYPYRWNAEFPDAIQFALNDRNGTTFRIHSPGELAKQLIKLKTDLLPAQEARAR